MLFFGFSWNFFYQTLSASSPDTRRREACTIRLFRRKSVGTIKALSWRCKCIPKSSFEGIQLSRCTFLSKSPLGQHGPSAQIPHHVLFTGSRPPCASRTEMRPAFGPRTPVAPSEIGKSGPLSKMPSICTPGLAPLIARTQADTGHAASGKFAPTLALKDMSKRVGCTPYGLGASGAKMKPDMLARLALGGCWPVTVRAQHAWRHTPIIIGI